MICDLPTYRRLTQDTTSVDGDVTAALNDAQQAVEQYTNRNFESAARTEIVRLYYSGRVYPKAFPITAVSNANSVIDGASIILGYGYQYAEGINPFVSGFGSDTTAYQPQITLHYTGGYTAQAMPAAIVRAVALTAHNALHTTVLAGVPVGATSVRLGDLAVSGPNLEGFASLSPAVCKLIEPFKRRLSEPFN